MRKTLATALYDDRLILCVHGKLPPTDREWEDVLWLVKDAADRHGHIRGIVVTQGGRPSSAQRARSVDPAKAPVSTPGTIAFVTESALVRGVLTAYEWITPKRYKGVWESRAYHPRDLRKAVQWLGLENQYKEIWEEIQRVTRELL